MQQKAQIPEGSRFGRLVVVEPAGFKTAPNGVRRSAYRCRCDCGAEVIATGTLLLSGGVKSCGCHRRDRMKHLNYKHGGFGTRLYMTWVDMRRRCHDERVDAYRYYGSRGIHVCAAWRKSWIAFRDWSFAHGYRDDLTLDRIDNEKGYCPSNCRWTTLDVQANNRRDTLWVDTPTGRMSLTHALRKYGKVCYATAHSRVFKNKWKPWDAIVTPPLTNKKRKAK